MALGRIALATVKGITYEVEQELTATMTLSLTNCIANGLESLVAYGGAEQASTPTPTSPVDIVCNNGTLKVRHESGLPLGYTAVEYITNTSYNYGALDTGLTATNDTQIETYFYRTATGSTNNAYIYGAGISSSGDDRITAYMSGSGNWRRGGEYVSITTSVGWHTSIQDSTGVTMDGTLTAYSSTWSFTTPDNLCILPSGRADIIRINYLKRYDSDVLTQHWIACMRESDSAYGMYDIVNDTFITNSYITGGSSITDDIEVYTDGTTETIEDELGNTATCENLLSVGDYIDEQEILTGEITRKVGIKVLDGTESWSLSNNVYLLYLTGRKAEKSTVLCSHFVYSSGTSSTAPDLSIISFLSANIGIRYDAKTSVSDFTDWLADEYANGTPVIVAYPLATETTETATAQTLNTQSGTNTIEITQASLNDLELYAKWKATS